MRVLAVLFVLSVVSCASSVPKENSNSSKSPSVGGEPINAGKCVRSGCNGEVCAEEGGGIYSTCLNLPQHRCYAKAICERQSDGQCRWTPTEEFRACMAPLTMEPSRRKLTPKKK